MQGIIRKSSLGNFFFKGDSPTEAPKETIEKESTIVEEAQENKPKTGTMKASFWALFRNNLWELNFFENYKNFRTYF